MSILDTTTNSIITSTGRSRPLSANLIACLLGVLDGAILIFTGLIVFLIYTSLINAGWAEDRYPTYLMVITTNMLATLAALYFSGLYSLSALSNPKITFTKIFSACFGLFLLLLFFGFAMQVSAEFSRGWAIAWCIANPLAIFLGRLFFGRFVQGSVLRERLTRNIAIVGSGVQGVRLSELLQNSADDAHSQLRVVGIYDDRRTRAVGPAPLGNLDDLIQAVRSNRVNDILVALPWTAERRVMEIMQKFRTLPVAVRLSPDFVGYDFAFPNFSQYNGIPVLNVSDEPLSSWDNLAKTTFDVVISSVVLILLSPVLLLIALLIKLDSPGRVFFRQKRPGFNNKLIEILKFRTLHEAEQDESGGIMVKRDDTRVTRMGRFLRRTSLDELPQLINVLKGEMSLVGPRPHPLEARAAGELYEKVVSEYSSRHNVKPGITGWAQINGWRGETDTEEKIRRRVEHDIHYISNWSLLTDLKILILTVPAVLGGRGAF